MNLICDCPSGKYRGYCKHASAVLRAAERGATFQFPLTFRSLTHASTIYTVECLDGE